MPIYLEYAPTGIFDEQINEAMAASKVEVKEKDKEEEQIHESKTIFVKNLNFKTAEEQLENLFTESKVGKVISVKIVRNSSN
mmetsp:Transcript_33512/g.32580  ORF Transcript_33512/g.32580 Transcript_33512/m.32580 type:complete len:82 (-) Transcript_33512:75-320(-)